MYLDELPTELLVQIYLSVSTIADALTMALTCRHMHAILKGRHLEILSTIAEAQYGPLDDAIQLITQNSSQPAHRRRTAVLSFALLKHIVKTGRVGQAWADLYPSQKWRENYQDRRLLTPSEEFKFRRALYRIWLYSRAFHNPDHPRSTRLNPLIVQERAQMLHNWSNNDLAEMIDVSMVIREVVQNNVCPSNGTIRRKFNNRFPDTNHQLLFNMPFNGRRFVRSPNALSSDFISHHRPSSTPDFLKFTSTQQHEPGSEGWGDDITHYYIVEDMLKLEPDQILWLRSNALSKTAVEEYVGCLGPWFDNNGETFGQTLEFVVAQRGLDLAEFMSAVSDGEAGVAWLGEPSLAF